jgi:type I restriction enzyme, S subunit
VTGLPSGWAQATVGEVADLTDGPFGSNLKTAHYTETGPRVIRLQNIGDGVFRDEHAHIDQARYDRLIKHAVKPGDIVAASLGESAPRACLVPGWLGPAIVKADCIRVRAHEGIDPGFLMSMLNSPPVRAQAASSIKGVGRPRLGLGGIKRLAIPVPPAGEQRRIVAEIEEQFSRIDAAERSLTQAKRRLTPMRNAILACSSAGYEPVELGALVTELRYGTSIKCSFEAEGRPVLRIPNVRRGSVDLSDLKFAIDAEVDLLPFTLDAGDLLFVRTNGSRDLIGRVASTAGAEGLAFASYLIRARPDRSRLEPRFAVIALSSPSLRELIESRAATTAGQYNLNLAALRSLPVPLPPIAEQRSIVADVERQLSIVDALGASIGAALRRSTALRRSILERAFTGKLVAHDPTDEPASVLLASIADGHEAHPGRSRRGRKIPA